jgi:UDP-glucose 4-epimerase
MTLHESQGFERRRVLITGGLGFIGSRLALTLSGAGADVSVLDLLVPDTGANDLHRAQLEGKARIIIGDIRDQKQVRELIRDVDMIFNLAALVSHVDSMLRPHDDMEVNVEAQLTLLEACRALNPAVRIVHTSTRQIYGKPDFLPVPESHAFRPPDVNGVNKLAGELYHDLYARVYGTRSIVLRLTNTYGPGMRIRDARQTFLGVWIRAMLEGFPLEVWGGEQLRDMLHVDDAVSAMILAASDHAPASGVFNVGGGSPMSLASLAQVLIDVNGGGTANVIPYPADRAAIEIGSFVSDASAIRQVLGWEPRISLRDGLSDSLEYYRAQRQHYL